MGVIYGLDCDKQNLKMMPKNETRLLKNGTLLINNTRSFTNNYCMERFYGSKQFLAEHPNFQNGELTAFICDKNRAPQLINNSNVVDEVKNYTNCTNDKTENNNATAEKNGVLNSVLLAYRFNFRLLGCIFFLITFIVYAMFWDVQLQVHGKAILSLIANLFISSVCLFTIKDTSILRCDEDICMLIGESLVSCTLTCHIKIIFRKFFVENLQ